MIHFSSLNWWYQISLSCQTSVMCFGCWIIHALLIVVSYSFHLLVSVYTFSVQTIGTILIVAVMRVMITNLLQRPCPGTPWPVTWFRKSYDCLARPEITCIVLIWKLAVKKDRNLGVNILNQSSLHCYTFCMVFKKTGRKK